MSRVPRLFACALCAVASLRAQDDSPLKFDPATEPAVLAVRRVQPAVVNISTERTVRAPVQDPFESFLNEFFGQGGAGAGNNSGPKPETRTARSLGSGFVVDADGYIITNEHVVERAADLKITVSFPDGATYDAKYMGGDRSFDLALLKIEPRNGKPFPFIDLSKPSQNYLGQTVLALGNPLGYKSSVSRGILSAKDREVTVEETRYKKLLQTDAAINPGNSGGPLVDLAGQLCGVNSVRLAFTPDRAPVQGIGFAIPAEVVAEKLALFRQQLKSPRTAANPSNDPAVSGFSKSPWDTGNLKIRPESKGALALKLFGIELQPLTDDLATTFGIPAEEGVLISDVEPGSPAHAAGLKRRVIIYKIGKYAVKSPAEVEKILADVKSGTAVEFIVGGTSRQLPFGMGKTNAQRVTVQLTAR